MIRIRADGRAGLGLPAALRVMPRVLRVTPAATTEKPDFSFSHTSPDFSTRFNSKQSKIHVLVLPD